VDKLKTTNILLFIIVFFIVGFTFQLTREVLIPILLAIILAYILDPAVYLFKKKIGIPLWLAVAGASALFLILFAAFSILFYKSVNDFANSFPVYQKKLILLIGKATKQLDAILNGSVQFNLLEDFGKLPITSIAFSIARSLVTYFLHFLLIFFFAVLIVYGKYRFQKKMVRAFPRKKGKMIPMIIAGIDREVKKYIVLKTLICLSTALTTTVILLIFHVEFAVIFGFLTFILVYIPSIGPTIAAILPAFMSLAQFSNPAMPAWVFLSLISMHIFVGGLIEPKLMGNTMNLSLLVIFFSLLFWGWLWGAAGIFLAVPMTTSIKIILEHIPITAPFAILLEQPRRRRNIV